MVWKPEVNSQETKSPQEGERNDCRLKSESELEASHLNLEIKAYQQKSFVGFEQFFV